MSAFEHLPVLHVYCDGGIIRVGKKKPLATWGMAAFLRSPSGMSLKFLGGFCGRVIVEPEHTEFIGATQVTSNTAELSAINWSLRWLHGKKYRHAVVFSDSQYAISMATEKWCSGKSGLLLAANAKLIQDTRQLFSQVAVDVSWVRGHVGNAGNEMADALAQYAKKFVADKKIKVTLETLNLWMQKP